MIAIALALSLAAGPSTKCNADAAATCEGATCTEIAEACAAQVSANDPTTALRAASIAMTAAGSAGQAKAIKLAAQALTDAAAAASERLD